MRDIKNLFEWKEEDYDQTVRVGNAWDNNYIASESNGDKYKTLSIKEHHDKIKLYLKDIIKNLQKIYVRKSQLTIAMKSA